MTEEGKPSAFTNVIVLGTKIGTQTREDGWFRMDHVPVGTRVIQIQALGCTKSLLPVEVKQGSTDTVLVQLECPLTRCFRQEHFTADCFQPNEGERQRVGSRCSVHPSVSLVSDTVRIGYGLLIAEPGFSAAESDSFPNALDRWNGGCDLEKWAFTEVAYCRECRRAQKRWLQRSAGRR